VVLAVEGQAPAHKALAVLVLQTEAVVVAVVRLQMPIKLVALAALGL
jgi:hypothetical protein